MASKTLYLGRALLERHNSIISGGEVSVTSESTSSVAKQIDEISAWFDATSIKDLDIKTIDSVTLSYQCKTSTNSSINYSYLEYLMKVSGVSGNKIEKTKTNNFLTTYATRKHDLGTWTKDELCSGSGAHLYFYVTMAVPWLTTSTVNIKDVKLIVNYTLNSYKITVNANNTEGGTVTGTGTYESGTKATLTATAKSGYKFVKWSDGDGNTNASRTVTVTANATYTAVFEKITYTATFKNYDGTVLQTVSVEHGSTPSYTGSTPTKAQDAQYTYAFSGWSPSLGAITANTTYTAQFTATKRSYTITTSVSPSGVGSVTGGGTGLYGTTKTLTAKANSGYKFVKWSDGVTSASRSVTITGEVTYTAVFEPVYVTFDSVLNFEKWKNNGITGSNATVSDITDTGFTLTSKSGVNEGTSTSIQFPVEAGKQYKIDIDITGSKWDVYIFFYDANTNSGTGLEFVDNATRRFSDGFNENAVFTAPTGAVKAVIRVDSNGASNSVNFNNFRIYPAEYSYMGSTVNAEDRSNVVSWDIPTPTRDGYEFIGWNTLPDGGGIAYNSGSAFPPDDLTLYSQWEALSLPEISSVQITPNPCDAGQGFIISVGFTE